MLPAHHAIAAATPHPRDADGGSMTAHPADEQYADKVISLARADAARAAANPARPSFRSVAMYMVDELARLAAEPGVPSTVAGDLRREARAIRTELVNRLPRRAA